MIVARNLLFCALVSASAFGGTTAITTSADSGPGSLRQAIVDANSGACAAPCTIEYGSAGALTVAPLTPLPAITAYGVSLENSQPGQEWTLEISGANVTSGSGLHLSGGGANVRGVVINGFPGSGIVLDQCGSCQLTWNILGLDRDRTRTVPNGQNGVTIIGGNQIYLDRNTISGNRGNGVYAIGGGNLDLSDAIGTDNPWGDGSATSLGNGASGIFLQDVKTARILAATIAYNGIDGIATAGSTTGVLIGDPSLPTLIFGNGLMPIDLGFDGITDAGRPVLTAAEISNGFMRVTGIASAPATINIFAGDRVNQYGIADAKTPLYAAKVDAGTFEFRFALTSDVTGQWISATATTDATSELSEPLRAMANDQNYLVTNANDSGPGSLRQAILDANDGICSENFPCRIQIAAAGLYRPSAPLPPIARSGIILAGPASDALPGAIVEGTITISSANGDLVGDSIRNLMIRSASGPGILVDATANSILNPTITNNQIVDNRGDGILVRGNVPFVHNGTFGSGNRIVFNLISGNDGDGVKLEGGFFELDSNTIADNQIGVEIRSGAQGHLENNTISANRDAGLSIAATNANAFKASIGDRFDMNAGPAIRLTPIVEPAPQLTSATYDPATQITTIKGTVTPALSPWSTVVVLFSSPFPEPDGRGSGAAVLVSATTVGPAFIATTSTDVRGKRISATATPFIYEGFKTTPDLFGQGFRYGTTSEFSKAIPVVTTGCPADVPQIVSGGALPFRWSTVAGASAYNVWVRPLRGTPQVAGTTSGDTFSPSLGPGVYDWFVEAIYPQCPSMKSDAARIAVPRQRVVR